MKPDQPEFKRMMNDDLEHRKKSRYRLGKQADLV